MPPFRATGLFIVLAPASLAATATPILFSQMPAASTWREPAPNVIISVDDSGSMNWDLRGCAAADWDTQTSPRVYHISNAINCPHYLNNPNPSRIALLRNSLFSTFGNPSSTPPNPGLLADGSIRLAWQALHDNGNSLPDQGARHLTPGAVNAIRPFTGQHRQNFHHFVERLKPFNITPSHLLMNNAFHYMRSPAGIHSPWADQPGVAQQTPYIPCRRSYHIFLTDGGWTTSPAITQLDAPNFGASDTQSIGGGAHRYNVRDNQTRVYRDTLRQHHRDTGKRFHTLSDYALLSWGMDLQDGSNGTQNMPNAIRPLIRQPRSETFTTLLCQSSRQGCASLAPFWNPRNNPANWQHLTQYTIGFGAEATTWGGNRLAPPQWDSTTDDTFGGDFALLANGERHWGDVLTQPSMRPSELWHMALNGRGKYFPARSAETLTRAFSDILGDILVDTGTPLVSAATNTHFLRNGQQIFQASFDAERFSGNLLARPVDSHSGAVQAHIDWDAAAQLDAMDIQQRFIFSAEDGKGLPWSNYQKLPLAQRTALSTNEHGNTDTRGPDRWHYLRGDRSQEVAAGGVFRDRNSRLGDMVHATIWYTGKPQAGHRDPGYTAFRSSAAPGKGARMPMVYVGANDGMLHGFAASSSATQDIDAGQELMAYIPAGIAKGPLRSLSERNYSHRYFVDGSVFTGDALVEAPARWSTLLVGSLGAGGKGYFVLDVSDPADFRDNNAEQLVLLDTTDLQDPDLGHLFAPPVLDDSASNLSRQIVRLNNQRWALLLGNGYNSDNEAPVLLIQYLDGNRERIKLSPCSQPIDTQHCNVKGNNGLSQPQPIDLNGDGRVDVVYAGDLLGHLWKFDLGNTDSAQWRTAFQGAPFFTSQRFGTRRQAITTAPAWRQHPQGGIMLVFGTGRDLNQDDTHSHGTDTLYALHDNSHFSHGAHGLKLRDGRPINRPQDRHLPDTLVQQSTDVKTLNDGTHKYYTSSSAVVDYRGQPKAVPPVPARRGWYMNLPFSGQRVLHQPRAFAGEKILIHSSIPASGGNNSRDPCAPPRRQAERTFLSVLNLFSGTPSATPVFHVRASALPTLLRPQSITMLESATNSPLLVRTASEMKLLPTQCQRGQNCAATDLVRGEYFGIRAGWHQLP